MGQEHRHALGQVQAAPATHAHDHVGPGLGGALGALAHLVDRHVRQHLVVRRDVHAGVAEHRDQLGELAGGAEAGVGAHQGPGA